MTSKQIKSAWRPWFGCVFTAYFFGLATVLLVHLVFGIVEWDDIMELATTMLVVGGGIAGIYVGGRSWEKRHGRNLSETEMLPDAGEAQTGYNGGEFGQ